MTDIVSALDTLPYVQHLSQPFICGKWTTVNKRPASCRKAAAWKFTKSSSPGKGRHKSGYFCTGHMLGVIQSSLYEKARANRAYEKSIKETIL